MIPDQWRDWFILSSVDECKLRGVKRVGGGERREGEPRLRQGHKLNPCVGVADSPDSYGLETVEDWDCSPECPVRQLDEQSGELKARSGGFTNGSVNPSSYSVKAKMDCPVYHDTGGASRFFYCAKASPAERGSGCEGLYWRREPLELIGRETWEGLKPKDRAQGCIHPTVKPVDLCRWLATLLLPPERETPRRLLVPFAGSGSEMIGAHLAGWDRVVGVEIDPEYVEIQRRRCAWWAEHGAPGVETATILAEGQARSEETQAGQLELMEVDGE